MSYYAPAKQHGISLLEAMLVLSVVAVLMVIATRSYFEQKSSYQWPINLAYTARSVTDLLQGMNVYYYSNCKALTGGVTLHCADLIAAGGISSQQCARIANNPWGAAFTTAILQQGVAPNVYYQLQVRAVFDMGKYPYPDAFAQLASLLRADAYPGIYHEKNVLRWTLLPNSTITNAGVWYSEPLTGKLTNNAGLFGGTSMNDSFWGMDAGLAAFTRSQGDASHGGAGCPD